MFEFLVGTVVIIFALLDPEQRAVLAGCIVALMAALILAVALPNVVMPIVVVVIGVAWLWCVLKTIVWVANLFPKRESPAEREKRERRAFVLGFLPPHLRHRADDILDRVTFDEKDLRVVAKRVLEENTAPIPWGWGPNVWAEADFDDQEIAKLYGVREWDRSTFLRVLHEERRRMFESGEAPDWVE